MHFLGEERGDDAQIGLRPEAAEGTGAAHGGIGHIGLDQRRSHQAAIDGAQIVERALRGTGRGITPEGAQTVEVSQRPTPGGWLIRPAMAWPMVKRCRRWGRWRSGR